MATRVRAPADPAPRAPSPAEAARAWAESIDLRGPAAARLEVARSRAPTTGPEPVQRAFALHHTWEENDLGAAHLFRIPGGGFAIHTREDDQGWLELFDARGALLASGVTGVQLDAHGAERPTIAWDAQPGAVREHIAPRDRSPEVSAFLDAIDDAKRPNSPSKRTVSARELGAATKVLVGDALTIAAVDGFEKAALRRVLADETTKLTFGARDLATRVADLYTWGSPTAPKSLRVRSLAAATGLTGALADEARFATASLPKRAKDPSVGAFVELARRAWTHLPARLVPATRTEATAVLRGAGATAAEVRTTLTALGGTGAKWFTGRAMSNDLHRPEDVGVVVFARSADGKKLAGVFVPVAAPTPDGRVRELLRELTGVDRAPSTTVEHAGPSWDLEWRPPHGGALRARLELDANGAPSIASVEVPPALEPGLARSLADRLTATYGRCDVTAYAGNDGPEGVGFVVAFTPAGQPRPVRLAQLRIHPGGDAEVTPFVPRARDATMPQQLAVGLAAAHAASMVAGPDVPAAAKLEVALRTAWADTSNIERTELDSPVGFGPGDELQLSMPRVWGDNAVFMTFAKDGTVRVEDFN